MGSENRIRALAEVEWAIARAVQPVSDLAGDLVGVVRRPFPLGDRGKIQLGDGFVGCDRMGQFGRAARPREVACGESLGGHEVRDVNDSYQQVLVFAGIGQPQSAASAQLLVGGTGHKAQGCG